MTDEYVPDEFETEDEPDWKLPIPDGAKRLSRKDIKEVDDRPITEVFVPQWGGTVLVQGVNRKQFYKSVNAARGSSRPGRGGQPQQLNLEMMEAYFLSDALVDPKYLPNEVSELMEKSAGAIQVIRDAADALSGMNADERRKAANAFRNG